MNRRVTGMAAFTIVAALALAGCSGSNDVGPDPGSGTGAGGAASSSASASDVNDADVMFAQMMIPHHEQAVDMAGILLDKDGIDEAVRTLAADITAAQQPEIDQMQAWLESWGADSGGSSMEGMNDGMMSDDNMRTLENATGTEAARLFLEQMTAHHEGAIKMAQAEIDQGKNPAAIDLARAIVTAQTAEIATMKDLLARL